MVEEKSVKKDGRHLVAYVEVFSSELDSFSAMLSHIPAARGFDLKFKRGAKIFSHTLHSNGEDFEAHACGSCEKVLPAFLGFYARHTDGNTDYDLLCPHLRKHLSKK